MKTPPGHRSRRRLAHAFGLRAERIAAVWLMFKGYRILARRYTVAGGEIDLVALRRDVVAFVEVKARGSLELAFETISVTKRRRIDRAVRHWLMRNAWAGGRVLRGDAIFIAPWRRPRHFEADGRQTEGLRMTAKIAVNALLVFALIAVAIFKYTFIAAHIVKLVRFATSDHKHHVR